MDAVDDDRYCKRLSEELGAFVVTVKPAFSSPSSTVT